MSLADPMVVTIAAVSKNLVRIDDGRYYSEYSLVEATQKFVAVVRTVELKAEADGRRKNRHTITLTQTIFATSTTPEIVRVGSMKMEHYENDDVTAWDDVVLAVAAQCTAPNIAKLNNKES